MTDSQTPKTDPNAPNAPPAEQPRRKHRKKGYRGYPNNPSAGGDIHTGRGFGGVGVAGATGGAGLVKAGVISERTRDDAEEADKQENDS